MGCTVGALPGSVRLITRPHSPASDALALLAPLSAAADDAAGSAAGGGAAAAGVDAAAEAAPDAAAAG